MSNINEILGFDPKNCTKEQAEAAEIVFDGIACRNHFYHFVRKAWPIAYGTPLIDGLHIAALCYHLQYLWESSEDAMIAATPPGCGKSSIACVMFSAWVWAKDPGAGQWFSSFAQALCDRDSLDTRRLVTSDWYTSRFGGFKLLDDQNQKRRFDNDMGGWRLAASIGSRAGFGEHPKLILIDDPFDPKQASSELERQAFRDYLTEKISTRGIVHGVKKVLIGQRLHEDDGHYNMREIHGENLIDLSIAMEFELDRKCRTEIKYHDIDEVDEEGNFVFHDFWEDPRTEEGQLMWPAVMTQEKVEKLKKGLRRAYSISSQLQQNPVAPDGDLIKEEWLTVVDKGPEHGKASRVWDKASSVGKRSDYTAGALLVDDGDLIYIVDMKHGKWERNDRDRLIEKTALQDSERWPQYEIRWEIEPGSSGKDAANMAAEKMADLGYRVRIDKPMGKPKKDASGHFTAGGWEILCDLLSAGRIRIVKGEWNFKFISECLAAPQGKHDDMIDAVALGVAKIATKRRTGKLNRPLLLVTPEEELESTGKKLCEQCVGLGCRACRYKGSTGGETLDDRFSFLDERDNQGELGVVW